MIENKHGEPRVSVAMIKNKHGEPRVSVVV